MHPNRIAFASRKRRCELEIYPHVQASWPQSGQTLAWLSAALEGTHDRLQLMLL